jgi:protein-S-isoprenylcysteine O-methyltransferase
MLTGIYQSIPPIAIGIAYYTLDTWMMRRYRLKPTAFERRDIFFTVLIFIVLALLVAQPLVAPWLGIQIAGGWGLALQALGLACLVSGLLLVAWVRLHLKSLFSERVEIQPDHYLVNSGPYARVRHPLYSAYFLLIFGLLFINPAMFELFILCYALAYFLRLAKEEETLLSNRLPGYREYMAATPRFAPRLWRRR